MMFWKAKSVGTKKQKWGDEITSNWDVPEQQRK